MYWLYIYIKTLSDFIGVKYIYIYILYYYSFRLNNANHRYNYTNHDIIMIKLYTCYQSTRTGLTTSLILKWSTTHVQSTWLIYRHTEVPIVQSNHHIIMHECVFVYIIIIGVIYQNHHKFYIYIYKQILLTFFYCINYY